MQVYIHADPMSLRQSQVLVHSPLPILLAPEGYQTGSPVSRRAGASDKLWHHQDRNGQAWIQMGTLRVGQFSISLKAIKAKRDRTIKDRAILLRCRKKAVADRRRRQAARMNPSYDPYGYNPYADTEWK